MKKATRLLLQQRPGSEHVLVNEVVLEGAIAKHCFQNTMLLIDTNEADLMMISGWMVGDLRGKRGTPIIPHYWVKNQKTNQYFDPTPKVEVTKQTFEYVTDSDILKYASADLYIPLSLKLHGNGKWQARNALGTGYIDLDKVDVEQLYKLVDY